MSKKYFESWPSELGTLPMTNWNWFPMTLNGAIWYTNGHVAMSVPPIRLWPEKCPKGMHYRVNNFQNPPAIPITQADLDRKDKPLVETERTEREGKNMDAKNYRPGVVRFMDAEGTEHAVARHYHALVMRKFPLASPFGDTQKDPLVYRDPNSTLVAILMPIHL